MTKKFINETINNYCKENNISKRKFTLYPLYIHLDGFSHSIGFIDHKARAGIRESDYTSVGYSNYTGNCWGYENEHQKDIAELLFKETPHYIYQNNAKEILL